VQPLDGITPLTIFFTAKPSTASGAALADALSVAPSSVRSPAASSFSGNIARRRLAGSRVPSEMGSLSPLAELRRRMDQNVSSHPAMPATPGPLDPGQLQMLSTPSEIERASSPPLSAQGRLGVGKAAPAIAASSANAVGTMSDLAARLRALDAAQESSNRPTPAGSAAQTTIRGGTALGKGQDAPDGPVFSSNYAGDDPYIKAHLEAVFLATFRDRPPSWGPHIGSGAPRRRGARSVSANARVVSSGSSNRRPEGNLIAYFTEHSGPISSLAVSPDHVFFVSGSEDGSVKVWDTARLEKNVTSRSRATYTAQRNGITALLMLEGTHCVASAAADGSVHVLRIDVNAASSLPKYGKLRLVSNFQLSTPGEHALCLLQGTSTSGISTAAAAAEAGPTTLMLGTSRSRITILDLRTMQVLQILRNPEHFGPITCMCADKKNIWLLVGTLGGVMALWDLRFSLLLKSWRVGEDVPRRDAQPGVVRVNRVVLHPSKGKGRVVLIAFERVGAGREPGAASNDVLVEAWDIDKGVRVETFETCDTPTASASKSRASTASAAAAPASDATRRDSIPAEPADEPSDLVHITPLQSAASGPYADGLGGAAQAIERLVRLHEAAATEPSDAALSGPRASAKAVLVGTEGYSSSSGSGVQVSGGWLDAGKLAAEADGAGNGGSQSGPAGYMLCAGEDRCIRFWDLGRAERSVCVGASDERSEFR
jgi:phosphoinositide-3-kinase regulatory subunit 4